MNFEDAKENIQPLAAGRNASILHASLHVESPQELLAQRRQLEKAIHDYTGNDALEPWYAYISWIEQSFPSGGKESGLEEVLTKCLSRFENEERYFQDRRMIKLYMKFIDSHQHPMECYQQLFNAGIGTMIADFYICWAYHYDMCGNTRKSDEIFRRGIACRAQPLEELQEAYQHFGFTVAQRLMYQDDEDVKENTKRQFEERRLALTSLRGHRRKANVGSIRTGAAVKNITPGTVQTVECGTSRQGNTRVEVFHDENANPNSAPAITSTTERHVAIQEPKSVVRSIIDAARNQENMKEPGPWNKAHDKKTSGKLFAGSSSSNDIGFNIHEDLQTLDNDNNSFCKLLQPPITDGERNYNKPFKYPPHFKNKNLPQNEWLTPVTIENQSERRTVPQYKKCYMYPRKNIEFQSEELRAYCWFRKRGISNDFTAKREKYWGNGIKGNVRQYPNFAKESDPQVLDKLDTFFKPEKPKGSVVPFNKMYDADEQVEYQWEELMSKRLRRNDTILMTADMDETACDNSERLQRRKSFFPSRRSTVVHHEQMPSVVDTDFKFKTPALPNITSTVSVVPKSITTNKIGFEIYTEPTTVKTPPLASDMEGAVGGATFDPEETCSTQTFNIFIKSQSVSTPKNTQKVATRQFGSILKIIPNPPEIISSPECPPVVEENVDEQENAPKEEAEYSPLLVKQLSTILETSEHGTTQGTHTTGGTTTKSSSSTSDSEGEREMVTRLLMPHTVLEPLEEQSRECSTIPQEVISSMENCNLQGSAIETAAVTVAPDVHDLSNKQLVTATAAIVTPATPANTRLQADPDLPVIAAAPSAGLNFSIFEDPTEALKSKEAGNFTRLDEPEDTAAGYAIRSVRFQEDKTETMPKMLLHSRSIAKFQEDKTETLPQIPIAHAALTQFEAETTDTMPKIALEPPISLPAKNFSANLDDSFEFFGQTPPGKSILHPRYEVSVFKDCMEARTPAAKRHCNVNTPDRTHLNPSRSMQKQSANSSTKNIKGPALFEDELDKVTAKKLIGSFSPPKPFAAQKTMGPSVPALHRVIARDSFMPDFSFIEESQPPPAVMVSNANRLATDNALPKEISSNIEATDDINSQKRKAISEALNSNATAAKESAARSDVQEQQAKSDLGDSYLKDFSEIMDSQPTQSDCKWHRSASKVKLTDVQKAKSVGNITNSFLKDFSAVMESQPTNQEKDVRQNKATTDKVEIALNRRGDEESVKFNFGNSYLKNSSIVLESQSINIERKLKQQSKHLTEQEPAVQQKSEIDIKKIEVGHSFLKDDSLVMESQPVVSERQIGQNRSLSTTTTTSSTTTKSSVTKPEVTHKVMQENDKPDLGSYYLKDFSFVPESQPLADTKLCQQNEMTSQKTNSDAVYQNLNPPVNIKNSYFKDFSMPLEAPANATKRQQEQLQKLLLESASSAPSKPLIFLDSFMKDFSSFQGPPADPISVKKCGTRLTFLNETKKLSDSIQSMPLPVNTKKDSLQVSTAVTPNELHLPDKARPSLVHPLPNIRFSAEKSFELNAETAMFSTNISMIKNSTLLPYKEANVFQAPTPIKERSLHIKLEDNNTSVTDKQSNVFKTPPPAVNKLPPTLPKVVTQSCVEQEKNTPNSTGAVPKTQSATKKLLRESKIPQPLSNFKTPAKNVRLEAEVVDGCESGGEADELDAEMSIYFKHTPKTPKIQQHIWIEKSPSPKSPSHNVYIHPETDLNLTHQIIEGIHDDPQVNPFNAYIKNAFLEQIDFSNYIDELPNCMLVGRVSRLNKASKVKVNDEEFDVLKLVGEGAYGVVYCGANDKTGKKYALKQERPPNFWEYYICLEVHSRLESDDLVSAFMSIDYALIGNNASILISPFSVHGSLITVCNKVKKHTLRNVDEYVVMVLTCELLSIIDHLHAINIIHADIKADNFLLMKNLDYYSTQYALQLIDFGVSIDMKSFKPKQTFVYAHDENAFKCVEMREGRPWTYQLDLYGLAGVIHVLLFGKFMDIEQGANGVWMHKTHVPRYINRTLWDTIFQALLNVRDCDSMPNLQNLRALIKEEIAGKEKFVVRKVAEFNSALNT